MFKKAGRGRQKAFCINEKCPNVLPEDKRGYYKKSDEKGESAEKAGKSVKKTTAKPAGKKTAKKTTKKTGAGK